MNPKKLSHHEQVAAFKIAGLLEGMPREQAADVLQQITVKANARSTVAGNYLRHESQMSTRVEDLEGNKLRPVLLQIVEQDERGATRLRVRRDDEKIDISDESQNHFLCVWVAEDQKLGETGLGALVAEFNGLKKIVDERVKEREQIGRDLDSMQREVTKLEERDKTMTEELRQLHKERDPERIETLVKERVATATVNLDAELKRLRSVIVERDREITELRTAKKRLKEANERLKEKR